MSTKDKPDPNGCYERALPDEPMFVFLARDPEAPWLIRRWARSREEHINVGMRPESDRTVVSEARRCADQMEIWRVSNFGKWRAGTA